MGKIKINKMSSKIQWGYLQDPGMTSFRQSEVAKSGYFPDQTEHSSVGVRPLPTEPAQSCVHSNTAVASSKNLFKIKSSTHLKSKSCLTQTSEMILNSMISESTQRFRRKPAHLRQSVEMQSNLHTFT